MKFVPAPTSLLHFGHARVEITPPVGIYHRMWGAARHDRATGVHRPLFADVLAFAPLPGNAESAPMLRVHLDLVGLMRLQYRELAATIATAAGVPEERVVVSFSHSHSAGYFAPNRTSLPGGELIPDYLASLNEKVAGATREAMARLQEATITYATGRCAMNANRDTWDADFGGHVCGFNPDVPGDETVVVARVTAPDGRPLASVVNYGCHPTTLAWENTLLSPDYPGAMRELVERETGAPCVFALGACGDLGPRRGFVGDPEVADRNGRQLGYAALAALNGLGPAGTDFEYTGPVISGATLGTWADRPLSPERREAASTFAYGSHVVELPLKSIPTPEQLQAEIREWEARREAAEAAGEAVTARDCGARAERARRWLGRVDELRGRETYPVPFSVLRAGDALWLTCAGEPYSALQVELRKRFPEKAVLASPLSGPMEIAYLLPREKYGLGLYQEEPSILAPGCLEALIEAIATAARDLEAGSASGITDQP